MSGCSYGIVNPEQTILQAWINKTYSERYGTSMSDTQSNLFWSFVVSSIAVGAIFGSLLTRSVSLWMTSDDEQDSG